MFARQPILLKALLPATLLLAACAPQIRTAMDQWPDGPRYSYQYYLDSNDAQRWHGPSRYWDSADVLIAECTWRDGKPWVGRWWIPAAGDAGSIGGLGAWMDFQEGKIVPTTTPVPKESGYVKSLQFPRAINLRSFADSAR